MIAADVVDEAQRLVAVPAALQQVEDDVLKGGGTAWIDLAHEAVAREQPSELPGTRSRPATIHPQAASSKARSAPARPADRRSAEAEPRATSPTFEQLSEALPMAPAGDDFFKDPRKVDRD